MKFDVFKKWAKSRKRYILISLSCIAFNIVIWMFDALTINNPIITNLCYISLGLFVGLSVGFMLSDYKFFHLTETVDKELQYLIGIREKIEEKIKQTKAESVKNQTTETELK